MVLRHLLLRELSLEARVSCFERFNDAFDFEPVDRPSPAEYAGLAPARPPCHGVCGPEGCYSDRCLVDRESEDEEEAAPR